MATRHEVIARPPRVCCAQQEAGVMICKQTDKAAVAASQRGSASSLLDGCHRKLATTL